MVFNKKALNEHGVITGNAITFHDIVDLFNIGIKFFSEPAQPRG